MEVSVLAEKTLNGFSVVQFRSSGADTLEYISLARASKEDKIKITEINEGGSVGSILVVNESDNFVFISEGDLLEGAKQNRVIVASIFLAPRSKYKIPVNCVEQGRWRHKSRGFTPHTQSAPSGIKKKVRNSVDMNLKYSNKYIADQMATWKSVDMHSRRYQKFSSSSDLLEIMNDKFISYESELHKQFAPDEKANGLAVFYGGDLVEIENYNRCDIYSEYFMKTVLSAFDEYEMFRKKDFTPGQGELKFKTVEMLDKIEVWEKTVHQSIAAGEEKRFRDETTSGFELIYDNKLVHLSVLKNSVN